MTKNAAASSNGYSAADIIRDLRTWDGDPDQPCGPDGLLRDAANEIERLLKLLAGTGAPVGNRTENPVDGSTPEGETRVRFPTCAVETTPAEPPVQQDATPGATLTGEDSVRQTAESSRPRELQPSEAASFSKALARSPRIIPVHVDATGKTREPPHCPSCNCGAEPASRESSPADLLGALQDVVHKDTGPVRAGHAVKSGAGE